MIDLRLGDCLEVMKTIKDNSIDAIITDPPYNIARKNNFHTMGRAGIDFGEWDKGFDLFSYIDEIPRILSKNDPLLLKIEEHPSTQEENTKQEKTTCPEKPQKPHESSSDSTLNVRLTSQKIQEIIEKL